MANRLDSLQRQYNTMMIYKAGPTGTTNVGGRYRMLVLARLETAPSAKLPRMLPPPSRPLPPLVPGNTFQKRSVSSPAPVTMVCPSGEAAR